MPAGLPLSGRGRQALPTVQPTFLAPGVLLLLLARCSPLLAAALYMFFETCAAASPRLTPAHTVCCRLVAALERVQGGLIGQTLSKFGIVGLYTVVVYSIGALQQLC